ncbi:Lysophosphatidylcholine acyltransferase 2 [Paragonimus heterotremus]|uniref:Lysophosphatidylcholine acyltransferase 2 n=1 Tax=Paragonimus heterotremus TaxID=100268 RepID=A0A8J4T0X1_9TREM|nr:Lysophosphatidylcholine acyltransferase 2 [Paragonimus heterotremus]
MGDSHELDAVDKVNFPPSPFVYNCTISHINHIKMFILSILILPLRAISTGITFLITLSLANYITYDCPMYPTKPHCNYKRRLLMPLLVLLARTVYFFGGIGWVRVKGTRASRNDAPILVLGPHSSFLDSLAVVVMGMPSCVAMVSHARSVIGGLIKVLQPILVDREDRSSRKRTVEAICSRAKSKEDWPQLLIFPEGTCANRSCLVSFRQGAFQPGVPVQPVLLRWPNTVDSSSWVWEGPSVWKLLWMTFTQFNTRFEIEFLPVYVPSEEERMDAHLYANNVRRKMAEALRVPTCDLLYDDFCRLRVAIECKLPNPEACVFLYGLLRTAFCYHRFSNLSLTNEQSYLDWVRLRLEALLSLARRSPHLTQIAFIDALFPNVQPDERETLLLNLTIENYTTTPLLGVNFRLFLTQACMLLYPSDPRRALHYAARSFKSIESSLSDLLLDDQPVDATAPTAGWALDRDDAYQLLFDVYRFDETETVVRLVQAASAGRPNPSSNAISVDSLYAILKTEASVQLESYLNFEKKLLARLRSRGRPLLDFDREKSYALNHC